MLKLKIYKIMSLNNLIQQLKDNNIQLDKRVKALEYSNNQLNNTVKELNSKN